MRPMAPVICLFIGAVALSEPAAGHLISVELHEAGSGAQDAPALARKLCRRYWMSVIS